MSPDHPDRPPPVASSPFTWVWDDQIPRGPVTDLFDVVRAPTYFDTSCVYRPADRVAGFTRSVLDDGFRVAWQINLMRQFHEGLSVPKAPDPDDHPS